MEFLHFLAILNLIDPWKTMMKEGNQWNAQISIRA